MNKSQKNKLHKRSLRRLKMRKQKDYRQRKKWTSSATVSKIEPVVQPDLEKLLKQ